MTIFQCNDPPILIRRQVPKEVKFPHIHLGLEEATESSTLDFHFLSGSFYNPSVVTKVLLLTEISHR